MKKRKQALFQSVISLLLCFSMLVGTTFAWFTDSVVTGMNTIAAGNLDVELYHSNAAVTDEKVDSNTKLFMDLQGDPILWEPGVVSYENLRVANEGDLALAYQLLINTANENHVVDPSGATYGLSQILKVGVVEGGITATDRAGVVASVEDANWTTLANFLRSGSLFPEGAGESEQTWGVVIYWEPGENDNYWNLNNGKQLDQGEYLMIDLGIRLIATQEQFENDSFGNDYDETAKKDVFPEFEGGSASVTVVPNDQNRTASEVVMTSGGVKAIVPAGVQLTEGTTQLVMTVSVMAESGANVVLGETDAMRSLDVHIEGISPNNTVPITVTLEEVAPVGLNMGNYKLYHVENGATVEMTLVDSVADFTSHNQFKYDPATGDVVLYMATFSEVAVVADTTKAWNGEVDHSWYVDKQSPYSIANADQLWSFSQIVGGMAKDEDGNAIGQHSFSGDIVKLVSNINLNDVEGDGKIFYPIGYNSNDGKYDKTGVAVTTGFYTFEGTFDGQGHSISNIYQNTWEMKGDNEYYAASEQRYRDGMGLFGKVYGGSVKNLTVKNFKSDGEYTTTGVIAAYADSKADKSAIFENIAIIDCNPRVYNIGNGGIVGCGGWYSKDTPTSEPITFNNITVDKTNKISALWGSWDVACGGIMGQYYPNSGCGVSFTNCNMSAQIDVHNDVCANYQYYAYRYAGMMIGSIRANLSADESGHIYPDMTGITASNCTVNYGDWNDYYYCELVDNSIASYTHDYQFSRLEKVDTLPETAEGTKHYYVKNSDGTVTCRHFIDGKLHNHSDSGSETVDGKTVPVEDKTCVSLPFSQLFTGYGWGVTSKGLDDFDGIQIKEVEQNTSVTKFTTKFTGNFLYRVGNQNTVNVGSLFDVVMNEDGTPKYTINSSGVVVTITSQHDDNIIMGSFTAPTADKNGDGETNWKDGQIKFDQTGVAKVTVQDYDYCTPTVLYLEVVDAKNITSAESATSHNVVLLNDVNGASNVKIANGYNFFGNGFALTYTGNGAYGSKDLKRGFVEIETGGHLENTRVLCKVFPQAYIYTNELKSEPYAYQYSAVMITGASRISNCYIYGARNNICIGAGDVTISNTITENGSLANIQIDKNASSDYTVTLNNLTTIQSRVNDDFGVGNVMLGVGVLVGTNESTSVPKLHLIGELNQYNWVNAEDAKAVTNDTAKAIINAALSSTDYVHTINGMASANLGIVYLNTLATEKSVVNDTGLPYKLSDVSMTISNVNVTGQVYSLSGATNDQIVTDSGSANKDTSNGYYEPQFQFDDDLGGQLVAETTDCDEFCYVEDGTVKIMFPEGDTKELNLAGLVNITKYSGQDLSIVITCKDSDGNAITVTDSKISLSETKDYTVTYSATDTVFYNKDGASVSETLSYSWDVPVTVSLKDKGTPNAYFEFDTNKQVIYYSGNSYSGYTQFIPFLAGLSIYDYEEGASNATLRFNGSDTTNGYNKIKSVSINNVNTTGEAQGYHIVTVELTDGGKIVIDMDVRATSGGSTHTGSVKVADSVVYVVNDGTTSAKGQLWRIYSYKFTGNNGVEIDSGAITFGTEGTDATSGTKPTGTFGEDSGDSDNCITGDTLITLADGTQKRMDELLETDLVRVFDHETGSYAEMPLLYYVNDGVDEYRVINLCFSDGTRTRLIGEHALFDMTLNRYVYIREDNYAEFVGHKFAKDNGKAGFESVTLTGAFITEEAVGCYSITSLYHLNHYIDGMLSLPGAIDGLFNYFEYDPVTLQYDQAKMKADIDKYGLYTYEDFAEYATEDMFDSILPAKYLKIAVGKGLITYEGILELFYMYLV